MESKVSIKSTNNIVATRFFCIYTFKNSIDGQYLRLLWKPFWYFLSMSSIFGSISLPYFLDTNIYIVSSKKTLCFHIYILGCKKTLLFSWLYKLRLNFSFLDTYFYTIGRNKMSLFFSI